MKATMIPIARVWMQSIGFVVPWTLFTCSLIAEEAVDFGKQIMPILQKNCVACHHLKEPEGGLVLESHEALMKGGDSGKFVTAGKSAESKLIDLVSGKKEPLMPPADNTVGAKKLTAAEIALLSRWIDEGAKPGTIAAKTNVSWSKISSDLQPIYTVASSEDGQFAAVGKGNLVTIYQWPAILGPTQSTQLIDPSVQATLGKDAPPASHLDLVQSMTFNPDGDLLVTGGYREIKFWRRQISPLSSDQMVTQGKGALIVATSDGKSIAVAKEETAVEIWDAVSGKKKWSLKGHIGTVESMAWAASGQELAVADSSGRIAIWGIRADGEGEVSILSAITQQGTKKLRQLQWLDPNTVVGVTEEAKLEAWKISRPAGENSTASIAQAPFLPDSVDVQSIGVLAGTPSRLVIASKDGNIKLAKLPGGEIESTWQHGSPVQLIATAADGKTVASLGASGETKIWVVGSPKPVAESNGDYRTQRLLASMNKNFSRQKSKIDRLTAKIPELEKAKKAELDSQEKQKMAKDKAAEALAAKAKEVDAAKKAMAESEASLAAAKKAVEEAMKKVEAVTKEVESKKEGIDKAEKSRKEAEVEVTKYDQILVAAAEAVQRAEKAIPVQQAEIEVENGLLKKMQTELDEANSKAKATAPAVAATFSPDSSRLIAVHADNSLRTIRVQKAKPEIVIDAVGGSSRGSIAVLNNGHVVVANGKDTVKGWNLSGNWILERTIGNAQESPFSDRVTALDISPDGKSLLVGSGPPSRAGDLKMLSTKDGSLVHDFGEIHSDTILCARFSPDGRRIATGGADKIIRISELDGKPFRSLEGHTHHVLSVAWHDDGQTIASAGADAAVKVWEVATGQQQRTIAGFGKEVTSLQYVGQTNTILSVSADKQGRLHDGSNGKSIRSFDGAGDSLYAVALAEDQSYAIAGGQDGKLWIWQLDNAKAIQTFK